MLTPSLAIITPVFNDWESFSQLLAALNAAAPGWGLVVDVFAVDDGSSQLPKYEEIPTDLHNLGEITIISVAGNMGHQRAVAIGLAHANQNLQHDRYLVMDCDGEDRPEEIARLLRLSVERPDTIIVAKRLQRSESWQFRAFYIIYKGLFRALTGRRINFGNFCLIPKSQLARITHMSELWNHFAGAVIRSRAPLASVMTTRGPRYAGESRMGFVSLVVHGLSAIAVFSDFMFVRLLVASLTLCALPIFVAVITLFMRLFTNLAIPGWTTNVMGFSLVILLQILTLLMTSVFISLSGRSSFPFVPAIYALSFIKDINCLRRPTKKPISYTYKGTELECFANAVRWKTYWASQIERHLGPRVLDVGAGIGATARVLCRNQNKWVALEPDPALAKRMQESVANGELPPFCEVRIGTVEDVHVLELFDTILYIDVLEHIADDRRELQQAAMRLDNSGCVVLIAPAHQILFTAFDSSIGHFRRYDRKMIRALNPVGLELIRLEYLDSFGLLASIGNRIFFNSPNPTVTQIKIWDRLLVPMSRYVDPFLGRKLGKSILAVWQKAAK